MADDNTNKIPGLSPTINHFKRYLHKSHTVFAFYTDNIRHGQSGDGLKQAA
jgi:hypothetical protein